MHILVLFSYFFSSSLIAQRMESPRTRYLYMFIIFIFPLRKLSDYEKTIFEEKIYSSSFYKNYSQHEVSSIPINKIKCV